MKYPWYDIVEEKEPLSQGDFITGCPILIPPPKISSGESISVEVVEYDVIVISQSCDLEHKKIELVLVCPYFPMEKFEEQNPIFKNSKNKETLRKGNMAGLHLLNKCEIKDFETGYLVVDLKKVHSVPFSFLDGNKKKRCRLLPPYREHLNQAFARSLIRVGLPEDIPPFK